MTGDRAMRTTCGLDDTQLMLARDAGDEWGSSAIALPGADGAGRVAGVIRSGRVSSSFVRRKMATSAMGSESERLAVSTTSPEYPRKRKSSAYAATSVSGQKERSARLSVDLPHSHSGSHIVGT